MREIAHAAHLILTIYSGTDRAVAKEKRMQGLIEPDRDDKGGLKMVGQCSREDKGHEIDSVLSAKSAISCSKRQFETILWS